MPGNFELFCKPYIVSSSSSIKFSIILIVNIVIIIIINGKRISLQITAGYCHIAPFITVKFVIFQYQLQSMKMKSVLCCKIYEVLCHALLNHDFIIHPKWIRLSFASWYPSRPRITLCRRRAQGWTERLRCVKLRHSYIAMTASIPPLSPNSSLRWPRPIDPYLLTTNTALMTTPDEPMSWKDNDHKVRPMTAAS